MTWPTLVPAVRRAAARQRALPPWRLLAALAIFALLLLVDGKDPMRAYRDTLVYVFGNTYGFSELLVRMTPLVLTSVAVALPSRLGLINVGGEGQLYMGAWLATAGALDFPDLPAWLLLPLMTALGFARRRAVGAGARRCCARRSSSTRRSRRSCSTISRH